MNSTIKDMLERRSCRNFKPDMVPKELIDQIIEAGLYSASGMGKQGTRIIAVTNKELRDKLSLENKTIMGQTGEYDPFYGGPVVLIVLADKSVPTSIYDGSLVMGNLMLAAHSLDLGSIWVHRAKEEFEMDCYKKLLAELGCEGEFEGIGHCVIGYVNGELPEAAPRKEDHVFYVE